jgi:hypothetical protein
MKNKNMVKAIMATACMFSMIGTANAELTILKTREHVNQDAGKQNNHQDNVPQNVVPVAPASVVPAIASPWDAQNGDPEIGNSAKQQYNDGGDY